MSTPLSKTYRMEFDESARSLVQQMSLEEKVDLMGGKVSLEELITDAQNPDRHYNWYPYPAGGNSRLGIPPMKFCDGPRGVVCGHGSTCFPVTMARGATFNTELEVAIGEAIAKEIRAYGGNLFGGVCVNVPYNPGWGRSQEVYGEDPHHMGAMGASLVRGIQKHNVIACVKHYAFNSMEISRFKVSIDCTKRTEREVFLPHFKDCIDAGAASVMSAYNLYKGVHCGHHPYLLNDVLKTQWGFDGFVISDFIWGIKDTVAAANGGMDIEMCATQFFGDKLVAAVRDGSVAETTVDEAVRRIIRTLLAFTEAPDTMEYPEDLIGGPEHKALAQQAAEESITLMKNNNQILPFSDDLRTLAVIGKLAAKENIGDHGSSRVFPHHVVTPLAGLKQRLPTTDIQYYDGSDIEAAQLAAEQADAVLFVVGYDHSDEGEYVSSEQLDNYAHSIGGDRIHSLGLHSEEIQLIQQIAPLNGHCAVVMMGGNMIMTTPWDTLVPAIVMAYYPGQEGGTALANILVGDVNPSGKLPFVTPFEETHLPQVNWDTTEQWYDYYHGYKKLDREGIQPMYPYGHGLSYTHFELSQHDVRVEKNRIVATCRVTNSGNRAGAEVVQLYVAFPNSKMEQPEKALKGFSKISLEPGSFQDVEIMCPFQKLAYFDEARDAWNLEAVEYVALIGTSSDPQDLTAVPFSLDA